MDMQVTSIAPDVAKVVLTGRLDSIGAAKIDLPFNAVAGAHRHVLVDMSAVTFVASIGIRTLMLGARPIQRRGGKLLLLNPCPEVEHVLETIGVADMLPIVRSETEAMAAFGG
jgi:anti-anti-sigma factor